MTVVSLSSLILLSSLSMFGEMWRNAEQPAGYVPTKNNNYDVKITLYALQFLHTASLVDQDWMEIVTMGVQLMYMLTQHQQTMKQQGFSQISIVASKAIHLLCYLLYCDLCILQLLHTASQ